MKQMLQTWMNRFRDLKLWKKFSIAYLVMFILPALVLALFLYSSFYDVIVTNSVNSEFTLTKQRASTLSATLDNVTYTANTILSHSFWENAFANSDQPVSFGTSDADSFLESVESMVDGELITAVRIYMEPEYMDHLTLADNAAASASEIYGTYWYGILSVQRDTDRLLCPSLYLSAKEAETYGSLAYVARLRAGTGAHAPSAGYVAVYFSDDRIDTILKQDLDVEGSAVYVLDDRDSVISTTDPRLSGLYYMPQSELVRIVETPGEYASVTVMDERFYLSYYPVGETGWTMVAVYPYDNLLQIGRSIVFRFLCIYLLFSLLAFMLTIVITRSIIRRVSAVSRQMQSVQRGRALPLDVDRPAQDEIGMLAESYNYMCGELNALMDQQMEAANQLRLTEFQALQSQINPHFLYNTLDAINWQALEGDTGMVVKTVRALSDFYRLTLTKADTITSLSRELEHVTLYISLLNIRFNDSIHFLVDIPDALLDCEIPKLTLQPLVENAALHGIAERVGRQGAITITGWLEEDDLILLISDDGVGMDEVTLHTLLSPKENEKSRSGIGVYNTDQRLKLYYGSQYGLSYHSIPGFGTDITLRIPCQHTDTPDTEQGQS